MGVAVLSLATLAWYCGTGQAPTVATVAYAQQAAATHAPANAPSQTQATGPTVTVTEPNHDATNTLELSGLEQKFQQVSKKVAPSVVAISAAINAVDTPHAVRSAEMNGERLQSILDRTTRTVGTGFVISPDGYILTNEHVVGEAEQIWVTTDDRKVYPAVVMGSDPRADLAVIKIPAAGLKPVKFAEPASAHRGQWVIALGNPYGLANEGDLAMSVGIISATDRSLPKLAAKENRLYCNLIQTTAEINPGNSGGPLFDLNGDVVGVNTAVVLPQKNTFGIGFALPITQRLLNEVADLKDGKEVIYGYVGVSVATATAADRAAASIDQPFGVRVDVVEDNSPAASVLKPGDVVLEIDGQLVKDSDQFVRQVGYTPVDRPAKFTLYRGGKPMVVHVTPHKRMLPAVAVTRETQRMRWNGMLLGPVPANWDKALQTAGLMVLAVDGASPAKSLGVAQGAIISSVAGKAIRSVTELQQVLDNTPSAQCTIELANSKSTVVSLDQGR